VQGFTKRRDYDRETHLDVTLALLHAATLKRNGHRRADSKNKHPCRHASLRDPSPGAQATSPIIAVALSP
jgi:hypothetical protein